MIEAERLVPLTNAPSADIFSDMKTFTVRDLDRQPTAVLDACENDGMARVRRRDGRSYTVQPERHGRRIKSLPDFKARIARIFPKPIPKAQAKLVDQLLAGE